MANTEFNTRIRLKYDSYANWMSEDPVLLAGEVAVSTIPTGGTSQTVAGSVTPPQALIKVGDGTTVYSGLPFVSGLAADVYSWAKAANKPTYTAAEIGGIDDYINTTIQDTDTQYKVEELSSHKGFNLYSKDKNGNWGATPVATIDLSDGFIETIEAGTANGTIKVDGVDVAVKGLDSAAYQPTSAFDAAGSATAAADNVKSVLIGASGDSASANTIYGAKKYAEQMKSEAVAADTNTTYTISYDSTAKKIYLTPSEGNRQEIDASVFIKDGMINSVTLDGDKNLVISFNTEAGKENISVPLSSLIDVYTGVNGSKINVSVSTDNKITAEIKTGTIAKTDLVSGVQTTLGLADTALQKADITTGSTNGTISVDGTNVSVKGLGSAAYTNSSAYDAAGAASTVKSEVIGASGNAATANTIYGAKKYADELAAGNLSEINGIKSRVTTVETKLGTVENNAEKNIIEIVKVNGTALNVSTSDRSVNVSVPTGALAGKDNVAETDLAADLANKINGKVNTSALAAVATSGKIDDLTQTDVIILNCGSASTIW